MPRPALPELSPRAPGSEDQDRHMCCSLRDVCRDQGWESLPAEHRYERRVSKVHIADTLSAGVSWGSVSSLPCVQGTVQQASPSNPHVVDPRK